MFCRWPMQRCCATCGQGHRPHAPQADPARAHPTHDGLTYSARLVVATAVSTTCPFSEPLPTSRFATVCMGPAILHPCVCIYKRASPTSCPPLLTAVFLVGKCRCIVLYFFAAHRGHRISPPLFHRARVLRNPRALEKLVDLPDPHLLHRSRSSSESHCRRDLLLSELRRQPHPILLFASWLIIDVTLVMQGRRPSDLTVDRRRRDTSLPPVSRPPTSSLSFGASWSPSCCRVGAPRDSESSGAHHVAGLAASARRQPCQVVVVRSHSGAGACTVLRSPHASAAPVG
jgi:hypothetical protein